MALVNQFETAEIFQHGDRAAAEDFDPFLGIGFVSVSQIADGALRSVGETQRSDHVIVTVFAWIRKALRLHLNWPSSDEEGQEVNEMTDFSDYATTALFRIV